MTDCGTNSADQHSPTHVERILSKVAGRFLLWISVRFRLHFGIRIPQPWAEPLPLYQPVKRENQESIPYAWQGRLLRPAYFWLKLRSGAFLAVGPLVKDVSNDFDRYWASQSAYPASLILDDEQPQADIAATAGNIKSSAEAQDYLDTMRSSTFVQELKNGQLNLEWASVHMVSDDPAKGLGF